MIVTLTPNPSVDRTVEVEALRKGEVHRATGTRVDPGGKGVNVSRALAAAGVPTVAVVPTGGAGSLELAALLAPQGVPLHGVPVTGSIRSNIALVEPDGTVTKINEAGPHLTPDEVTALQAAVVGLAPGASWVVLSGSLPRGVPDSLYADLVAPLRAAGARVAVDGSGPALAAAAPAAPDLLKPNDEELAELVGRPLPTYGDVVTAAQELLAGGVATLLVSLGAQGALLVSSDVVLHGHAVVAHPRSNVGAGDSTLAGYLAGDPEPKTALARAVAFGAAAVSLPGSGVPGPDDLHLESVVVTDSIDLDTPLAPPTHR